MSCEKPRKIIDITAHGVADFRRQLNAAIAQAQRLGGVPAPNQRGLASIDQRPRGAGFCVLRLGVDNLPLNAIIGS